MKLSIIIPAHNEQDRIRKTVRTYFDYFAQKQQDGVLTFELVIVLNGCTDNTLTVVHEEVKNEQNCIIIDLPQAGKGYAIKSGFADALTRENDFIGFVDADMATHPNYFYDLVAQIGDTDGIIASRYMPDSHIVPPRPALKRWGSMLVYEPLIWLLFGLNYYDFQCGAKLFTREVIKQVTPHLHVAHWAFDLEFLYQCKLFGFTIKEVPTTWYDQPGSKLQTIRSGLKMIGSLFAIRFRNSWIGKNFSK